jgi:acetyl esterase/lipase
MKPPPERTGYPAGEDIVAARTALEAARLAGQWRTEPPGEEELLAGRRALVFRPAGPPRARILHLHGGGFRMGCPEWEGPLARVVADRAQVEVHALQYRLSPENPFPAGVNDALAALEALDSDLPLVIAGDSAGGGVAASAALAATASGIPLAGLILLSPWLDLTVTAATFDSNAASDAMFSRAAAESAAALYLQGHDPRDPLASPLFADLLRLPPTLLSVGSGEVLAEDSRAFHRRLTEAGVTSRLLDLPGMDHVAVVRDLAAPGSAETLAAMLDLLGDIAAV